MSLGSILNNNKAVFAGDVHDGIHIRRLAIEMHRDDRLGACGNRCFDLRHVDRCIIGYAIDKYRPRTRLGDRESGGDKGVGAGNDFIPVPDAGSLKRQVKSVGAGGNGDAVFNFAECCKLLLEQNDIFA